MPRFDMPLTRPALLRELYGFDFTDELFAFWDWHQGLSSEDKRTFADVLGLALVGPFDVLAGRFDGASPRYPAVLHWRYVLDPPEFFTVLSGNIDKLHWGYWFDDPGRKEPVVAHYYAADAYELKRDVSLFAALENHIERRREGVEERLEYDPAGAEDYRKELEVLAAFCAKLPETKEPTSVRKTIAATPEGMGIVAPPETYARPWPSTPDVIDEAAIVELVDRELAAGRPGTVLFIGRSIWEPARTLAFEVLARAYGALDRAPLVKIVEAHRAHPALPDLDILSYGSGE